MHCYRYRWLYTIAINAFLAMLVFMQDTGPALARLTTLHAEKIALQHTLLLHQQSFKRTQSMKVKRTTFNESKFDTLRYVLALINLYGLNVQSVNWAAAKDAKQINNKIIKIIMQGSFQQFAALVFMLNTTSNALFVGNFYLKAENNVKLFMLEIDAPEHVFRDLTLLPVSKVLYSNDVLCTQHSFANNLNDVNQTKSMLLYTFKMVGFLQQGKQAQALLQLPTHEVIPVSIGFVLGQEQGKVMAIRENQIHFLLPNHKWWILKM